MRTIFVIGLVLVCAFMAGWFTIHREDGETTIKLNGDEFRNDTRKVITKGHEYLHRHSDGQYPDQQLQPGQSVPASWAQQQQIPNQQYTNQQQYQPQQQQLQYPNQQYQAGQPVQQQQPQGGFYYPDNQQAKRPPAPWEGQLNAPTQGQQPGQF